MFRFRFRDFFKPRRSLPVDETVTKNSVTLNLTKIRAHMNNGGSITDLLSQLCHHLNREDVLVILKKAGINVETEEAI